MNIVLIVILIAIVAFAIGFVISKILYDERPSGTMFATNVDGRKDLWLEWDSQEEWDKAFGKSRVSFRVKY